MDYEQFRVTLGDADDGIPSESPPEPELVIHFAGPYRQLQRDLQSRSRTDVTAPEIEIAIRTVSQTAAHDGAILTIADSVTGTYLLECDLDDITSRSFIDAVQTYATATDDPSYLVHMETETERFISFRTHLLLVYGPEGTLHRDWSLIPADVEV